MILILSHKNSIMSGCLSGRRWHAAPPLVVTYVNLLEPFFHSDSRYWISCHFSVIRCLEFFFKYILLAFKKKIRNYQKLYHKRKMK